MKKLVLLIGLPGAGKDTQADLLENKLGYRIIRVGQEVRKIAKSNPELFKSEVQGFLAPASIIDEIIENRLSEFSENETIVCDGYPRNMQQAKSLDKLIKKYTIKILAAVYIELPESEVLKRLALRNREDDNTEAVLKRINIFHDSTNQVLCYYESKNLLKTINGVGTVEEVNQRICKAIS